MKATNTIVNLSASAVLFTALAGSICAGPVKFISLSKDIEYVQSSLTKVNLLPPSWRPFAFNADVDGDNRASIAKLSPKPTIKLPANSGFESLYNLKPSLGLGQDDDDGWNFGFVKKGNLESEFDNWGTNTKSELDSAFPNGNYVFTVQGKTINLSLPRDTYPTAPKLTLSGGRWVNEEYRIKANQALTVNSGTYTGYGTHLNDYINIDMESDDEDVFEQGQVTKKLAGGPPQSSAKSITKKVPANTLTAGTTYYVSVAFGSIVSQSTALPGATAIASYGVSTEVRVVVE
jgi:hypothetical protein